MTDASLGTALAAARERGDLGPLLEAIPYARFLGLRIASPSPSLVAVLPFHDDLVGNPVLPALHGGTLGMVLETVSLLEVVSVARTDTLPRVVTLTVDYLRPAKPLDTFARGRILRQGRRVATVLAEAWQESPDRPVSAALVHVLLASDEPPDGGESVTR